MNPSQARIELIIDVLEETGQRALALCELRPPQLIKAILQEFHSLEYLGDDAADYYLARAESGALLDENASLEQLNIGDRLALKEREAPLPDGTYRPARPIYFREPQEAKTYPIPWLPAIIGRHSEHQAHDELVAVDLRSYAAGLRVSRRHVRVSEGDGRYFIENLSSNPVSLLSPQQSGPVAVTQQRRPLAPGDVVRLDRSGIELKFIVRPVALTPDAEAPVPTREEEATPAEQA
jgi:hypothetical protein